jgi:hypothetical protein
VWIEEAGNILLEAFTESNFYSEADTFYNEYGGFGTSSMVMLEGEPFYFEPLTVGEYAFSIDSRNRPDRFFRRIPYTLRQIVEKWGVDVLSEELRMRVQNNEAASLEHVYSVVHAVYYENYLHFPITSVYYIDAEYNSLNIALSSTNKPLETGGYEEFPFIVGRWSVIGNDPYGIGVGHHSLPNCKRLQEMERSFLQGTHKAIDPPVNIPSEMRGKTDLLPGGSNYYSNPERQVQQTYNVALDFAGVTNAIQRVEAQIQRDFFNDLLISASRDPNASPLRTGEVETKERERLIQMAPVVQRLQSEVFEPMIERGFNILLRQGRIPELPPELAELVGDFQIRVTSPLAQAQKQLEARSIEGFMSFAGGAAQFDPAALDMVNIDAAINEYHDITGAPELVLRDSGQVAQIRQQRAQQQAEEKQRQDQMLAQSAQQAGMESRAQVAKDLSEAGVNLQEQGFSLPS